MNNERVRDFVHTLQHVEESVQWGAHLVFWVGEKSVGGKMFAMLDLDGDGECVAILSAGPEGMTELCEREGVRPAPYLARAHWVCVEQWHALTWPEWKDVLIRAHAIVLAKMPRRTRELLAKQRARL
jgi:predicted DNA-binding protein (MmcQ/YjbR family)